MHNLSLLLPYLRRYRGLIAVGIFVAAISTGFSTVSPYLLGRAVDQLRGGEFQTHILLQYALLIIAASLADGALKFGMRQLVGRSAFYIEYDLRNDLFRQFLRLDQHFYSANHTGDLMTRATNDLGAVRQMLGPGINSTVTAGLTLIIVAVLMLRIDVQLGLVTLLMLPTISVAFAIIGKQMRDRFRHVQDQFGRISTRAQENFSGIRTIKAYAQEEAEMQTFGAANREYQRLNLRYVLLAGLVWPLVTLLLSLTVAIVLLIGGQAVAEGRITLGDFVRFNAYLALLTYPMIALGWTVTLIQQGSASMGRISEVLRHEPLVQSTVGSQPRPALGGAIELRDVGVRYGETWVLRDISLHVPRGSTIAIVGATGAGKTTLVNLLGRVLDPTEGWIAIDGIDVREWSLEQLRAQLGFVPQDTFLFSVPLRDNVTFGRPDATDAAIDEALLVSQLVNDMPQFPQGLDTLLGERGVTLSGGQKQRAAIARAVLRDPAILILDDSMSSVDTHTAAEILNNLKRVMHKRTSIIIAQRIATVKDADRIFVLHHGVIVEQGTHAELLQHNGRYAAMYRRELLRAELEERE